jgi:predicted ATPase
MVQTTFAQNRPTHIAFIDKLYHLTEGNPFYIEVTLKATYDPDNLFRFSFNVVPAVATQTEM